MTIGVNSINLASMNENVSFMQFGKMNGGRPPKPHFTQMLNQITTDLNLTDEQKVKVSSVLQNNISKMDEERESEMRLGQKPSRETMKAKMDENLINLKSDLKSILSTEQLDKFTSIMQSLGERTPTQLAKQDFNPDGNFSFLV